MGKEVKVPKEAELRLSRLVKKAEQQQELVSKLEADLKEANKQLRKLLELDIPELMDELGYEAIATDEYALTIKDIMTASVPQEKRAAVCSWLVKHELGSLVSNEVKLSFKPTEMKLFERTLRLLSKQEPIADRVVTVQNVNTGSMKKAVKELLESGADVDLELLGVSVVRQATINRKKEAING